MLKGRWQRSRVAGGLGALALMGSLAGSSVSPAGAAFPGGNGLLACQTGRTGNSEIFTFGSNGTEVNPTNLTNHPAGDARPRWRSDGRKIAFESSRAGGSNIFVMDADGSNVRQVTFTGDASAPAWHPDGSQLLYQRNFGMLNFDVYKVNVDGSSPTAVSPTPFEDSLPAWSPDGTVIAFSSRRAQGNTVGPDIYTMDSFGNNVTNITNLPNIEDSWPNWSPDGSQIAFHSRRDDPAGEEIYRMNADGSNVVRLTFNLPPTTATSFDIFPAWSPDGSRIVFNSGRDGASVGDFAFGEVYTMNASDGSGIVRITNNLAPLAAGVDQRCDWQPLCTIYGSGDIEGTRNADIICGSEGPDRIAGLGGNDIVYGFGGNDDIDAGGGDDRVFGGLGDDDLFGNEGADFLSAGPGGDRIVADAGERIDVGQGPGDLCVVANVLGPCPPPLS